MPKIIEVYVDGSCINNGTPKSRGGIGIYFPNGEYPNVSEGYIKGKVINKMTNNVCELMAIYRTFQIVPGDLELRIYSDSKYAILSLTNWLYDWIISGKLKKMCNLDLILMTFNEMIRRPAPVTFVHVEGHRGIAGNEIADDLAKKASGFYSRGSSPM